MHKPLLLRERPKGVGREVNAPIRDDKPNPVWKLGSEHGNHLVTGDIGAIDQEREPITGAGAIIGDQQNRIPRGGDDGLRDRVSEPALFGPPRLIFLFTSRQSLPPLVTERLPLLRGSRLGGLSASPLLASARQGHGAVVGQVLLTGALHACLPFINELHPGPVFLLPLESGGAPSCAQQRGLMAEIDALLTVWIA